MPTNRLVVKQEVAVYADVLFTAANEAGGQKAVMDVYDQVEQVSKLLITDYSIVEALNNPEFSGEQRYNLVKGVFADLNPALCEVLAVMAERGDVSLIHRLFRAYEETIDEKLNIRVVEVTTVVPLDDDLRTLIKDKAAKDLGKNVVLREHIDPSIMAGIIMSTGGKRIDASVLTQLNRARYVLKETPDGGES